MGPALRLPLCGLILGAPFAAFAGCEAPRKLEQVAADDFRAGLSRWRLEAEDARAVVTAQGAVLDIATPAGLSLWWRAPLSGDYAIRFTAVALPAPASAGPHAGRLSDLNMFWNALEADGSAPGARSGKFADDDTLPTYYAGFGANGNTTTRLRLDDGGQRHLLAGFADAASAEPGEQPMTRDTRLRLARLRGDVPADKPLVLSEFGADAKAGFNDPQLRRKFSEDFQADHDRATLAMAAKVPTLRGLSPWVLKDFRSPRREHPVFQNGWNRKGLISETGRRKLAFYLLADHYQALPH